MRSETREELANYLLNHCFIIGNLESTREKYYLLTNNEEEMQEIFRPLGYSIVINRNLRVAQLVNLHELGRVELRKYESILLLIFRLLYVEKRETLSVSEQLVLVTVEEIEDEYNKLNLPKKLDRRMLEDALRTFKRYNLAIMIDRLENTSARIQILPSVMLAMPEQAITKAYEKTKELLLQYEKTNQSFAEEDQSND
jgi:hypothetical protein